MRIRPSKILAIFKLSLLKKATEYTEITEKFREKNLRDLRNPRFFQETLKFYSQNTPENKAVCYLTDQQLSFVFSNAQAILAKACLKGRL